MAGHLCNAWKSVLQLPFHYSSNQAQKHVSTMQRTFQIICKRSKTYSFDDKTPIEYRDYEYIEKSTLPTLHFQKSLPRLPIPELEQTCERYLSAQQPFLDTTQYEKTKSYIKEFMKLEGQACQLALKREDKANKDTSYISKPWFDMYLKDRTPLPINYNPFLVFVDDPISNDQLLRATNLVISSLRFYKSLNEGLLEPEVFHLSPEKSKTKKFINVCWMLPTAFSWYGAYMFNAYPLDMSQFPNLFNTTRVPHPGQDKIKHVHGKRHILVMRKGHLFVFDVIDKNGILLKEKEILGAIAKVCKRQELYDREFPIGVLTTEERNTWAETRQHLQSLGNNAEHLELIDSALFCLCLDDDTVGKDPVKMVRNYLHADGRNRWFDKSFQLIVTRDATAGINFEHSWGDGVAVLRFFNSIHKDIERKRWITGEENQYDTNVVVRKLDFVLDDRLKSQILAAKEKYEETCNSLDVNVMDYKKFGRDFLKPHDISPDALMQLTFQMAQHKVGGKPVATYESCSTSAYKHGRTEAVRPCTMETVAFCKHLQEKYVDMLKLREQLHKCSKVHTQMIKDAATGYGFDRHLFSLKLKAESLGLKPSIYSDPAYASINHNILSTSTLNSDCLQMGGFGPVVKDGYGIGYSVWKERMGTIITNYKSHTNGAQFKDAIEHSVNALHDLLVMTANVCK